jgi:hypothetical protein
VLLQAAHYRKRYTLGMKRIRKNSLPRLSRDAQRLIHLAQGLANSGSMLEERYWETRLSSELVRLFDAGADGSVEGALDHLYTTLPLAYDALIESAEGHAESMEIGEHDALLVAAPILAWSKYSIYSGALRSDAVDTLTAHFYGHIAAADTRVNVAPYLYSIDQLPRDLSATRALATGLARRAVGLRVPEPAKTGLPETAPLLADTRYLVAVLVAPRGAAIFRWQEQVNREQVLERWRAQILPNLQTLLPGCVIDVLLPDGYHVACRESDRAVRPYSIRAALAYLEAALSTPVGQLRAVIAPFGVERAEEFRVAFTQRQVPDVVHGVVWPLYGREDTPEGGSPTDEIVALLAENGVSDTVLLDQLFPPEFCDDCGSPLFADPQGDLVHAELPEEAEPPSAQLH